MNEIKTRMNQYYNLLPPIDGRGDVALNNKNNIKLNLNSVLKLYFND